MSLDSARSVIRPFGSHIRHTQLLSCNGRASSFHLLLPLFSRRSPLSQPFPSNPSVTPPRLRFGKPPGGLQASLMVAGGVLLSYFLCSSLAVFSFFQTRSVVRCRSMHAYTPCGYCPKSDSPALLRSSCQKDTQLGFRTAPMRAREHDSTLFDINLCCRTRCIR